MIRLALILLCLAPMSSLLAAAFNARASSTKTPLNGTVKLTFNTNMPDKEHIDVQAAIVQACQLPALTNHWKLIGEPIVEQHSKAKDVTVELLLLPRETGPQQPPAIPVRWMDGNRSAVFPQVLVENHIKLGGESLDVPGEVEQVGGYTWGMKREDFNKISAKPLPTGSNVRVEPRPGLSLQFLHGSLAGATLRVGSMSLIEAKAELMQRWGDPFSEDSERVTWQLGWVRIEATSEAETIRIDMLHEGIADRLRRARVRAEVFSLLDSKPNPTEAPKPQTNTKAGAQKPTSGPSTEDFEREFNRKLNLPRP